jgi:hypothetical protein
LDTLKKPYEIIIKTKTPITQESLKPTNKFLLPATLETAKGSFFIIEQIKIIDNDRLSFFMKNIHPELGLYAIIKGFPGEIITTQNINVSFRIRCIKGENYILSAIIDPISIQ